MAKQEADNIKKVSTNFLKKHGYFCGYRSGVITWTSGWDEHKSSVSVECSILNDDSYLRIYYTQTDRATKEKKDFDYKIPLITTPCRYGSKRYWFICPWYKSGVYCGKRVSTLYKGGDYFACRHCYDLTYNSRKKNRSSKYYSFGRLFDIDEKIEKLGLETKRYTYKGKPTKKRRKIERLHGEMNYIARVTKLW